MKFPEEMAGKKVRCKGCGHVFRVEVEEDDDDEPVRKKPAKSKAKSSAKDKPTKKPAVKTKPDAKKPETPKAKPKPSASDDDSDGNPYGLTDEYIGKRCPHCASPMGDDDVVCLECGYNTWTRERLTSKKVAERTFWDWMLWLFPAITAVVIILSLIGFDVWFVLSPADTDPESFWANDNFRKGIKLWTVIGTMFVVVMSGIFAVKRLVLNPVPPEREKPLEFSTFLSIMGALLVGTLLMLGAIATPLCFVIFLDGIPIGFGFWALMISMFSSGYGTIAGALAFNK